MQSKFKFKYSTYSVCAFGCTKRDDLYEKVSESFTQSIHPGINEVAVFFELVIESFIQSIHPGMNKDVVFFE